METTQQQIEMTAEERREFELFKKAKALKEQEEKARENRELYKQLVDDEIERSIPILLGIRDQLHESKQRVRENFRTILEMKSELFKVKEEQRSHSFTTSDGTKRIIIGQHTLDAYRDTVEDGIAIVKEYIGSLAKDAKTEALVNMVFRLLSRDAKGTLKASRIVQLRKIADEIGDERFLEGVKIIEESYQPEVSKQYVRADIKDENGQWQPIALGMTEA